MVRTAHAQLCRIETWSAEREREYICMSPSLCTLRVARTLHVLKTGERDCSAHSFRKAHARAPRRVNHAPMIFDPPRAFVALRSLAVGTVVITTREWRGVAPAPEAVSAALPALAAYAAV